MDEEGSSVSRAVSYSELVFEVKIHVLLNISHLDLTLHLVVTSLVNHVLNSLVVKHVFAVTGLVVVEADILVFTCERSDTEVSLGWVKIAGGARQRYEFGLKRHKLTKGICSA